MINLYGEVISQDTSSTTVRIDHSADEKGSVVPESLLTTPEANKLFENWYLQHSNSNAAEALLKKLKQISLRPPALQAAMSSEMLGPMVDVTYADRKKAPFKVSGRSLIIALDKAARLSTRF